MIKLARKQELRNSIIKNKATSISYAWLHVYKDGEWRWCGVNDDVTHLNVYRYTFFFDSYPDLRFIKGLSDWEATNQSITKAFKEIEKSLNKDDKS